MIWLILGFILFVAVSIWIFYEGYHFGEDCLMCCLTLIACTILTLLVTLMFSAITTACAEPEYNIVSDTKIIALKDNQNISGNFYIMGGYVNEELYYYYAVETEFGYKTEKLRADNAYIKYTDGDAHIERYEGTFKNKYAIIWGAPMYNDRYIIYCPEGTITNEFKVDLE